MGIIAFLFCSTITATNRLCTPKKKYTSLDELRAQCGLPTVAEEIKNINRNRYRRSEPKK